MDVAHEAHRFESQAAADMAERGKVQPRPGDGSVHEQMVQHMAYMQKYEPEKLQATLKYIAGDTAGKATLGITAKLEQDAHGGVTGITFGYDQNAPKNLLPEMNAGYIRDEINGILPNPKDEAEAQRLRDAMSGPKPGAVQGELDKLVAQKTDSVKVDDLLHSLTMQSTGTGISGYGNGDSWRDEVYVKSPNHPSAQNEVVAAINLPYKNR